MGGFEGGDEGGFWDEDTLLDSISHPKKKIPSFSDIHFEQGIYSLKAHSGVSIYYKINGIEDINPNFQARLMQVRKYFTLVQLVPHECEGFEVLGLDDAVSLHQAHDALLAYTADTEIEEFFTQYQLHVHPQTQDYACEASIIAAYLRLVKEACSLALSNAELAKISININPFIPFFLHNVASATVSGHGEIIDAFDEEALDLQFHHHKPTLDRHILHQCYQEKECNAEKDALWMQNTSQEILTKTQDERVLNGLYSCAIASDSSLQNVYEDSLFLNAIDLNFFKLK